MSALHTDEGQILRRIYVYQEEIAAMQFRAEACPLLKSQLETAIVLVERLASNLRHLLQETEGRST